MNARLQRAEKYNLAFARGGIDGALQTGNLDAIVAPTYSFASSPAAVAGYPDISIPVGLTPEGKPAVNARNGAAGTSGCGDLFGASAAVNRQNTPPIPLRNRQTPSALKTVPPEWREFSDVRRSLAI